MMWFNSGLGYGMGFGWIFMLLFWVLIIVGIASAIRCLLSGGKSCSRNSALDILQERYAKGEINKKEFLEKQKDLE